MKPCFNRVLKYFLGAFYLSKITIYGIIENRKTLYIEFVI